MAEESWRWMILLAAEWIQAFTGTNFDFSSYSSDLKAAMRISQVQLNHLAVASDLGKAFGWSSGLALLYLPLPVVLFIAAGLGLAAYGTQWLLITSRISLPYVPVFVACLLAGLSICWFNTVCFVLCIRNFAGSRSLALSLTVSFNGISAALYTLAANSINGSSSSYLLLNAAVPVLTSLVVLLPILRQTPPVSSPEPSQSQHASDPHQCDIHIFLILNAIAFLTGIYLLILGPASPNPFTSRILLAGAIILLALPSIIAAREWAPRTVHYSTEGSGDEDLRKELIARDDETNDVIKINPDGGGGGTGCLRRCINKLMAMDRIAKLGDEHSAKSLIRRLDFWIYYFSYFSGGTLGLVYSNNLGQIAQSLGRQPQTSMLINVYSSCSFFGRLISAAPDFLGWKAGFATARTGWLALALIPMPLAFFLLAAEAESGRALVAGTALVGLSSGFVFAAAAAVTSELFGPASFGLNHNIVITNIPLGSLLYGLLAALIYDANGEVGAGVAGEVGEAAPGLTRMVVCMGRRCYSKTFLVWGGISTIGLICSIVLYLRTRAAYHHHPLRRGEGSRQEDFRLVLAKGPFDS